MRVLTSTLIPTIAISMFGCSSMPDHNSQDQKRYSQAELDLLVERAKVEERQRISKELNRQHVQKTIFNEIRARQNNLENNANQQLEQLDKTSSREIVKIIPKNRTPVLYKEIEGVPYMRCAANSLVPIVNTQGKWTYSSKF
jgi:hypothetical protein